MTTVVLNRRRFLVLTALASGGLAVDIYQPFNSVSAQTPPRPAVIPPAPFPVNPKPWLPPVGGGVEVTPWFVISPDNFITMRISQSETGQGVFTSNPMMFCEELECDWSKVRAMYVDVNRQVTTHVYDTRRGGGIGTPVAGSVRDGRIVYQRAGAELRERLKAAAAAEWSVPIAEIQAKSGILTHVPTGRSKTYGDVAAKAVTVKLDAEPKIKKPSEFSTMIGKHVRLLDVEIKARGEAVYGIDIRLPNMLYAAVKMAPMHGGTLKSFDFNAIKQRRGVHSAVPLTGNELPTDGVAVVADSWWHAKTAIDAMPVEWAAGPNATHGGSTDYFAEFRAKLNESGLVAFDEGDAATALKNSAKIIEATYELPHQAHATMEPMNCTAQVTADRVDVWVGSQNPDQSLQVAAKLSGLPPEKVFVYNCFSGGGFGGRPRECVHHAVMVAKTLNGRPVKLLWSREVDLDTDAYRAMALAKCHGAISSTGMPTAATYRLVTNKSPYPPVPVGRRSITMDGPAAWGFHALPYGIPNQRAEITTLDTSVPYGFWRATGHSNAAFIIESFIDELAYEAKQDPYKFRRALIDANPGTDPSFRHKAEWLRALDIVAQKSGWGTPLPRGSGRGIAIEDRRKHTSPEAQRVLNDSPLVSVVATVAEVTVSREGRLRVTRMTVAHDVGDGLVNPEAVERQIHGQFAWAMGAGLLQEITLENGRVVQTNFQNYPMLRMSEFPTRIDVEYFEKSELIAGAGEEVIPSIMPAICNAIFAATGKRLRALPLLQKHEDLRWT